MVLPSVASASEMAPPTARAGSSCEQPWADRAPWGLRNLPRIVGAAGNCAGSQYAARRANLGSNNSFGAVALTAWLGDRQCQRQWRWRFSGLDQGAIGQSGYIAWNDHTLVEWLRGWVRSPEVLTRPQASAQGSQTFGFPPYDIVGRDDHFDWLSYLSLIHI